MYIFQRASPGKQSTGNRPLPAPCLQSSVGLLMLSAVACRAAVGELNGLITFKVFGLLLLLGRRGGGESPGAFETHIPISPNDIIT